MHARWHLKYDGSSQLSPVCKRAIGRCRRIRIDRLIVGLSGPVFEAEHRQRGDRLRLPGPVVQSDIYPEEDVSRLLRSIEAAARDPLDAIDGNEPPDERHR